MPTYLYECKECSQQFEVDQRITEDPLKDCSCGANGQLRRLIQPTAIMFKGDGFFVNDTKPKPAGECTGNPPTCGRCQAPDA